MNDARHKIFLERLSALSSEEIQRIIDNIDSVCLDTFNYDAQHHTFCPLAIGMGLQNISDPSDEKIQRLIGERFIPVNALKGIPGKFYTDNRKADLLRVCQQVLNERQ